MKGTISFINTKGFGFVEVEGYEKGVFFHASACKGHFDDLSKGQEVTLGEIFQTEKGFSTNKIII